MPARFRCCHLRPECVKEAGFEAVLPHPHGEVIYGEKGEKAACARSEPSVKYPLTAKRGPLKVKISLNMDSLGAGDDKQLEAQALERLILGAKSGDFEARDALYQVYMPLLKSLAKKRGDEVSEVNELIEAGKKGLLMATQKYKQGLGADKFKLLAIDHIDRAMTDATNSGFFRRLFRSK
jgi:hypothetical protein